jgi:hypothetical protein
VQGSSVWNLGFNVPAKADSAPAWQANSAVMSICFVRRKPKVKSDSSYSCHFNEMARPAGLEPAAFCLEGSCSIRLSYGRTADHPHSKAYLNRTESHEVNSESLL